MARAAYDDGGDCVSSLPADTVEEAVAIAQDWAAQGYEAWARDDDWNIVWHSCRTSPLVTLLKMQRR